MSEFGYLSAVSTIMKAITESLGKDIPLQDWESWFDAETTIVRNEHLLFLSLIKASQESSDRSINFNIGVGIYNQIWILAEFIKILMMYRFLKVVCWFALKALCIISNIIL